MYYVINALSYCAILLCYLVVLQLRRRSHVSLLLEYELLFFKMPAGSLASRAQTHVSSQKAIVKTFKSLFTCIPQL